MSTSRISPDFEEFVGRYPSQWEVDLDISQEYGIDILTGVDDTWTDMRARVQALVSGIQNEFKPLVGVISTAFSNMNYTSREIANREQMTQQAQAYVDAMRAAGEITAKCDNCTKEKDAVRSKRVKNKGPETTPFRRRGRV